MNRTSLATVLAILLALSQPAWAQGHGIGNGNGNSENGSGQGNGNGQGNGKGENAEGESTGQDGNDAGYGNAAPEQGQGEVGATPSAANSELSENDALAAVEAGRAVELATILPDVRSRTGGEVINAQLQQVGEFLIYAVTVLTPSGQVLTEHYYARSGAYVGK